MAKDVRFEILSHVVEIANSSVDVFERLESIMGVVTTHLVARLSVLFMNDDEDNRMLLAHSWPVLHESLEDLVAVPGRGPVGMAASGRKPVLTTVRPPSGDLVTDRLAQDGELAACFPVMDDNRMYGVLTLLFRPGMGLDSDEVRMLQMVAREMAGSIRNFRLYFEAKKRITELNVLSDLGKAAVSTIELDQLLDTVAGICAKLLGAKGGLLTIIDAHGKELKAAYGPVPDSCRRDKPDGPACVRCLGPLVKPEDQCCRVSMPGGAEAGALCAPLSFKGEYTGRLCVFDKVINPEGKGTGFNEEDRNLLSTMASMVSSALENALTFQRVEDLAQRNEEMVGALATLNEISTALMTTVDFEEICVILLHAVVHPAGLDHGKVLFFMADPESGALSPVAFMSKGNKELKRGELTQSLLAAKADKAQAFAEMTLPLASLQSRVHKDDCVLGQTVLEKRSVLIPKPAESPGVRDDVLKLLGPDPILTVPMIAKDKVVGILVVSEKEQSTHLGERDAKFLAMLANQGGLALENSRLYAGLESANRELARMRNRLIEADKLAALGEIAAGVAHEIRNPLVSVGGFTRRIRKQVGDDSPITKYLDVIIEEVTRLERTLNEMLDFSSEAKGGFEEHDLNQIMDQALGLMSREFIENNVTVLKEYGDVPKVFCDDRQIKHVFLNLFLNAVQAMGPKGGLLKVRSYQATREGQRLVVGEVSDTGGGIGLDSIHNIFNPFFTTKDTGTGLGLSIVHKIVTRHYGMVEVHNRDGEGATFLVTLPAAEEGRAYLK